MISRSLYKGSPGVAIPYKSPPLVKIRTSELLGLQKPKGPALMRKSTMMHFEKVNDPTDPLYLMKSNYYRNNYVQELEEAKMFSGKSSRFVLGNLLTELPVENFHLDSPTKMHHNNKNIANVRDRTKFNHYSLLKTKNYY